jgi:hypothetical protein
MLAVSKDKDLEALKRLLDIALPTPNIALPSSSRNLDIIEAEAWVRGESILTYIL